MSVQCNQYLAYGYKIDFGTAREQLIEIYGEDGYTALSDKYHDSAFDDKIVEVYGCSMIEDGMNGKYTFFGKIYAKSSNYEHLETTEINSAVPERDRIITEHEFQRIFGYTPGEPKFYIITHYR